MEDIDYKKRCEEYEKRMGIGQDDPAKDGYLVLVAQLRQQNEYLKDFRLKDKIGNAVKDDPVYARSMDLIEKLPKMISSVSVLRIELKMEGEEKKSTYKPVTAKSIAEDEEE